MAPFKREKALLDSSQATILLMGSKGKNGPSPKSTLRQAMNKSACQMPKVLPSTVPQIRVKPTKCLNRLPSPDEQEEIPSPATRAITLSGREIGSGWLLPAFSSRVINPWVAVTK